MKFKITHVLVVMVFPFLLSAETDVLKLINRVRGEPVDPRELIEEHVRNNEWEEALAVNESITADTRRTYRNKAYKEQIVSVVTFLRSYDECRALETDSTANPTVNMLFSCYEKTRELSMELPASLNISDDLLKRINDAGIRVTDRRNDLYLKKQSTEKAAGQ